MNMVYPARILCLFLFLPSEFESFQYINFKWFFWKHTYSLPRGDFCLQYFVCLQYFLLTFRSIILYIDIISWNMTKLSAVYLIKLYILKPWPPWKLHLKIGVLRWWLRWNEVVIVDANPIASNYLIIPN